MADGTEAPTEPTAHEALSPEKDDDLELSERGRVLIEETAELVVELPD